MLQRHTIGIIGTGQVGMAEARALFQQRIAMAASDLRQ